MIEDSIILTFDCTIITGLFVFYAFLVAFAERFEKRRKKVYIDLAIRYLAFAQLIFVISAFLVLVDQSVWALRMTLFGLVVLAIYFSLMIYDRGLIGGN